MIEEENENSPKIIQNFYIGSVGQLNPMAQTIVNNYYGDKQKEKSSNTEINKDDIRPQIIDYVSKILLMTKDEWRNKYVDLWKDILEIEEVDAKIYNKGKQVGTVFNREMAANIIHFLGNYQGKKKGVFKAWDAKKISIQLEGTWECSTRNHLGVSPSTSIQNAISKLIASPKYKPIAH